MNVPATAMPGMTAMGYRGVGGTREIAEGRHTAVIYGLIKEKKYEDTIELLAPQLQNFPTSRAALSLTAYCYFHSEKYEDAAKYYDQLVKVCPDEDNYKLHHAQALYKTGNFVEAYKVTTTIESQALQHEVLKLQAAIKYDEDDVQTTKSLVEQCAPEDPETIVNQACLLYKEGKYDAARQKFSEAQDRAGNQPVVGYYIALCHYRMRQYQVAFDKVSKVISESAKAHPEFPVATMEQGLEVRSVGNTYALHESALVQAFNLKAAIEFQKKQLPQARSSLTCMPPRLEEELDPVTLHNTALMNFDNDKKEGFEKLKFLLEVNPCPPEAFANLLLLSCKEQLYDFAATVLAEHTDMTYKCLSPELYEYINATLLQQTAPEEAYRKFDDLANKHVENLRRLVKNLQDAITRDNDILTRALIDYNDALEAYIPILMAQARIYWDRENYVKVEKILFQSVEFFYLDIEENSRVEQILRQLGEVALESEVWKLNLAHCFFMQGTKFKEAVKYYEPVVKKYENNLLDNVAAIVLANLCVAHVMNTKNEDAEELIRKIEKEEKQVMKEDVERQTFHSCIVNLVVGTLYCSRNYFEFGISRVIKSFEPMQKKLNTDTWFYTKRCVISLIEAVAKHQLVLKDEVFHDLVGFLENAERCGRKIPTVISLVPDHPIDAEKNNVSYEARMLKLLILKLRAF